MSEGTYQVERAEPGSDFRCSFASDDRNLADKHYEQAVRLVASCGGEVRLVAVEAGERMVLAQFRRPAT